MDSLTVFIITVPSVGHINTVLPLMEELVQKRKVKVVFYGYERFKIEVEKTGAKFRAYKNVHYRDMVFTFPEHKITHRRHVLLDMVNKLEHDLIGIAKAIDNERPDLVLYENEAFHGRWILDLLETNYRNANTLRDSGKAGLFIPNSPPPLSMVYSTSLVHQDGVYPNETEKQILDVKNTEKLYAFTHMRKSMNKAKSVCKRLGIKYKDPFKVMNESKETTLVFTFPEFHPRVNELDNKYLFVGSSIHVDFHRDGLAFTNSYSIKHLLEKYKPINPLRTIDDTKKFYEDKIIFVSFGTTVNNNLPLYLKVIEAFATFDYEPLKDYQPNMLLKNLDVIMSVGNECADRINRMIKSRKISVPPNVIIVPSTGQMAVLQRASLFITHSGMGSTSEAIYYGVPMICLPKRGDQALIAHRTANELGLGVILDTLQVNSNQIRSTIHDILKDKSRYERCIHYSKVSHNYIGQKNAADLVIKEIELNRGVINTI